MRRILVERARRKQRVRHGGGRRRLELDRLDSLQLCDDSSHGPGDDATAELLALDDALTRLAAKEPEVEQLVKLRYFAGLTIEQAATAMGISVRSANRHWSYAKAWLFQQLSDGEDDDDAH
jgi:RNA polymerase sigma factor (TIGR02999 family)